MKQPSYQVRHHDLGLDDPGKMFVAAKSHTASATKHTGLLILLSALVSIATSIIWFNFVTLVILMNMDSSSFLSFVISVATLALTYPVHLVLNFFILKRMLRRRYQAKTNEAMDRAIDEYEVRKFIQGQNDMSRAPAVGTKLSE